MAAGDARSFEMVDLGQDEDTIAEQQIQALTLEELQDRKDHFNRNNQVGPLFLCNVNCHKRAQENHTLWKSYIKDQHQEADCQVKISFLMSLQRRNSCWEDLRSSA
jgi:hypothetical protein